MSTHGTILVKGDAQDWWLHAYSDGHHVEAIEFLMHLPWKIHLAGRKEELGAWQYRSHVVNPVRPWKNKEDFVDTYIRHIPFQTCDCCIANWIIWAKFNHWLAIERKHLPWSQDPDITVTVRNWKDRLHTYTIDAMQEKEDEEYKKWTESRVEKVAKGLNESVQDRNSKITHETGLVEVPIDFILIDLMWNDYQKIQAGESVDDLPMLREPGGPSEGNLISGFIEGAFGGENP